MKIRHRVNRLGRRYCTKDGFDLIEAMVPLQHARLDAARLRRIAGLGGPAGDVVRAGIGAGGDPADGRAARLAAALGAVAVGAFLGMALKPSSSATKE